MNDWTVIVASNDETVLQNCLSQSPDLVMARQLLVQRGFTSASTAYNAGLEAARSELIVLAHQDVYLPPGWWNSLEHALAVLETTDPNWGVLGPFGIHANGETRGCVYSSGLSANAGSPLPAPAEIATLDELLLVIRRSSGLRFDPDLHGFHLYGTDICLEAGRRGLKSYAVPAFCIHNSNGIRLLPAAYWRAYSYLQRKWYVRLPVPTPCARITRWPWAPLWYYLRHWPVDLLRPTPTGRRNPNPAALYASLQNDALNPTMPRPGSTKHSSQTKW